MIWSDTATVLTTVGKFFIVLIACAVLDIIGMTIYTGIKNHVSPHIIFKKGLPTLLIALTTASSAAAYTVMFAQLGIPAEALAIAIACDTLADFISTGGDQYLIPLELLNASNICFYDVGAICFTWKRW